LINFLIAAINVIKKINQSKALQNMSQ